ncbi:steroid delta-isomerase-like uncharacterized protein [Mycobacterium sp. MAA66]|uniref:ester cyclase n=1 Tax=Mycobacterium sp. MAA66 TaxID=3156297 RepID=UPI003512DD8C
MTPTTQATAPLDIMDDDTLDQAIATAKAHAAELRKWAQMWWDAWNTQDLDGVVALVHEDIVYEDPSMMGEHIRGRAQFRAFVEMFFRAFPDALFEQSEWPIYLATEGVGVAAPWRVTGTFTGDMRGGPSPMALAPTGKRVDIKGVDLYEYRDGLLHKWASVVNPLEMLEQLGIAPVRSALPILVRVQRALAPLVRILGK